MTDTAISPVRTVAGRDVPAAGTWTLDPAHTIVTFEARHMMISKVRGTFGGVTGSIQVAEDPMESKVEAVLDVATVDTGAEDRDNHLRSADFFDVENHPSIRFESTSITTIDDGYRMSGDLTVKDETRPVTLDFELSGGLVDPFGNQRVAFSAEFELNREDWGLTWNMPLETGGVLVGKKVKVTLDTEAILSS